MAGVCGVRLFRGRMAKGSSRNKCLMSAFRAPKAENSTYARRATLRFATHLTTLHGKGEPVPCGDRRAVPSHPKASQHSAARIFPAWSLRRWR